MNLMETIVTVVALAWGALIPWQLYTWQKYRDLVAHRKYAALEHEAKMAYMKSAQEAVAAQQQVHVKEMHEEMN